MIMQSHDSLNAFLGLVDKNNVPVGDALKLLLKKTLLIFV